jgi:hypothetical protein
MAIPALEPPIADVVPALELEPIALHELPEMPVRPVPATEVPLRPVASTEVPTMTPTPEEARVSFKELATALLGAAALTAIPAAQPIAAAPAVKEPAPVLEMPKLEPVTPVQVETPVAKVAAPQVDEIVAPALTVEALVASAAAAAPASPQPAAPEAPRLPQEFEGLKFPNDGVLTRQWMEFLSQMSGAK